MSRLLLRALCWCAALLAEAAPLKAQTNTAEMLQRAIHLYQQVEIEQALVILRQIISPSSPFEVSREQRVQAYTYLGAALALEQGAQRRDSAIVYFRAAIERDPFVDLDPQDFSPAQLSAFAEAKNRTFAVAVRSVRADTVQPGTSTLTFRSLTSHAATLHVEIRLGDATRRVLYDGPNDGLREIGWDGTVGAGELPAAGRYELMVIARSNLLGLMDSASVFFDVALDHPPLEDTLPDLGLQDLLPEVHPASAPANDLLKGIGVAAAALLIQRALPAGSLGPGRAGLSGAVAGIEALAGVFAYFGGRSHREIPANIAENQRRQAARLARNAEIAQRNGEALRQSKLVITPASGGGP
jgi:tetratricopeptide (TPR) repeat protein